MVKIKHLKGLKLPAKASLFYTAASAVAKAASMLFTPLFTRIMSKEEYGYYALYVSVLGLTTVITTSLASGSVMYKGYAKYKGEEDKFCSAAFGLSLISIIPVCFVVFLVRGFLGLGVELVPVLVLQLALDAAISAKCSRYKFSYSYGKGTLMTLSSALLSPVLSLFLIRYMDGSYSRIFGLLIISAIIATPTIVESLRLGLFDGKMWKFCSQFSLALLPNAIAYSVIREADKLILAAFMGRAALASYAVAHSVGMGLTFITGSLGSALHPWMMRKLESRNEEQLYKTVGDISAALASLSVFVVALAPEALAILTPKAYTVALPAILPTALSVLPTFTLSALAVISIHSGKPHYTSVASGIGALVNVISNILLIPGLSYFGAGVSLLLAYAVANLVCILLLKRVTDAHRLYSPSLCLMFAVCAVLSAIMTAVWHNLAIRLLLLIIPTVLLLKILRSVKGYIRENFN